MDFSKLLEFFLNGQTGTIILLVLFLMEIIIKPILYKFINGHRKHPFLKKTIMPLIACSIASGLAFGISPDSISSVSETILWGFSVGIISTFIYSAGGLTYVSKKLKIEEKVAGSIYPPSIGGKDE